MAYPHDLPINYAQPTIMHIDLNSCFAIIEQQANPLIRHKPVAVAAYDTPRGMVLAASYEAKKMGIKLGVNVREAQAMCPGIIVMMPDPPKYRDAHKRFKQVLLNYTSNVYPRSIDEFVIDFRGSPAMRSGLSLSEVGYQIKKDIKESLGEYVTVNVGIATNRILAKTAAGMNKPDGLTVIDARNLRQTLANLELTDLPGISYRYEARLNRAGIYSPLQFLDTNGEFLKKQVFKSKVGMDWHWRLRGWEVDAVNWPRRSIGHQYALPDKTTDRQKLARILMKLCEKTGRRLRGGGYTASGIRLWLTYTNHAFWAHGENIKNDMYATQDIYFQAQKLLRQVIMPAPVAHMGVTVYKLASCEPEQLGLFDGGRMDKRALAKAADKVNDRYGEFTVFPAIMASMDDIILDRIAFGNIKDMD
jgi:DNA polymerase IV